MKKRTTYIIILTIIAVIILIICIISPIASLYSECKFYYGRENAKEMLIPTSSEDKKIAEKIIKEVDSAFSFTGSKKDAVKKYGVLSQYCSSDSATKSQRHELSLRKSKFEKSTGYIWFEYWCRFLNKNGDEISGSGSASNKILVKLYLEKTHNKWEVTDILEAP